MTISPQAEEKPRATFQGFPRLPPAHIRILHLEAGSGDAPLIGTFENVDVDNAGSYEPISYVWAQKPSESGDANAITVYQDGSKWTIRLTVNLHCALKRVRNPDTERRIWVDQICIDQASEEKSSQVRLMNKIYQKAHHVLAWLGVDKENLARAAFELVHRLDEALRRSQDLQGNAAYNEELEVLIEADRLALDQLTQLPWFKRGWIVQEIGTTAPATMFWGQESIDWEILHRVCENLNAFHHLRSKLSLRTSNIKYMYRRFVEPDPSSHHANRFNFIYELHRARGLLFSDPRDRIFAWLGHYSVRKPNKELATLEANYDGTSEVDVYIDVAAKALRGCEDGIGGSGLIALAAVQHKSLQRSDFTAKVLDAELTANENEGMPSWVPNWKTYESFILSEPINAHRAHGTTKPQLFISDDNKILTIHGIQFDKIVMCSRPLGIKAFHTSKGEKKTESVIHYLWHEVCRQGKYKSQGGYPGNEDILYAFMQTLSNGCVQIAGREGTPYREIPSSRWTEQHAMYLQSHVLEPDSIDEDILRIAQEATLSGKVEEWSRAANAASQNRLFATTEKGYFVLAPGVAEIGDEVCVLYGGKSPFCLRQSGSHYWLVGECYVHGLMDGEAIEMRDQGVLEEQVFVVK